MQNAQNLAACAEKAAAQQVSWAAERAELELKLKQSEKRAQEAAQAAEESVAAAERQAEERSAQAAQQRLEFFSAQQRLAQEHAAELQRVRAAAEKGWSKQQKKIISNLQKDVEKARQEAALDGSCRAAARGAEASAKVDAARAAAAEVSAQLAAALGQLQEKEAALQQLKQKNDGLQSCVSRLTNREGGLCTLVHSTFTRSLILVTSFCAQLGRQSWSSAQVARGELSSRSRGSAWSERERLLKALSCAKKWSSSRPSCRPVSGRSVVQTAPS